MSLDACNRLVQLLRYELDWPLPYAELDDLTFAYRHSEIQFLRNESTQIERILQLRPLPGLKKAVFLIDQGHHDLNRFAIRRVAMHFSTRPNRLAPRPYFPVEDMIFLVISSKDRVSAAHFKGSAAIAATMAVTGPEAFDRCEAFKLSLTWSDLLEEGWSLGAFNYTRTVRSRSRLHCSREFLEIHSPASIDLFDLACSIEAVSQAEEDRWFDHARRGEAWATEKILLSNMRLVFDVAYRYWQYYRFCRVPFEDILSGGIEGLLVAIRKYEYERGHRFVSFAWQWVGNKADRALVDGLWPVKVPRYVWEKICLACRDVHRFGTAIGTSEAHASFSLQTEDTDPLDDVIRILTWENVVHADPEELDALADIGAEEELTEILDSMALPSQLGHLNWRQQNVILLRNGLHPDAWGQKITLEDIAAKLNITRERVRQIEIQALKKLRSSDGFTLDSSPHGSV